MSSGAFRETRETAPTLFGRSGSGDERDVASIVGYFDTDHALRHRHTDRAMTSSAVPNDIGYSLTHRSCQNRIGGSGQWAVSALLAITVHLVGDARRCEHDPRAR